MPSGASQSPQTGRHTNFEQRHPICVSYLRLGECRESLGLTQMEFSQRIEVSLDTIRNWEQGKRRPKGAAKALLKVLDKSPESALLALG